MIDELAFATFDERAAVVAAAAIGILAIVFRGVVLAGAKRLGQAGLVVAGLTLCLLVGVALWRHYDEGVPVMQTLQQGSEFIKDAIRVTFDGMAAAFEDG